jgi:NDP-sugar pyrophosphorylase family protein
VEALVLAAGFGTRFRPRTLETPKPLLPFLGREILFRLFDHLIGEGIDRFVVNSHHLADRLRARVGESYRGCSVVFSREEEILGTAGAIRRASEAGFLRGEEFFVVNGDLFTTLPLSRLSAALPSGALSALAVLPNETPDDETPLWSSPAGRLAAVGRHPAAALDGPWLFTGIQLARRALVDRIPKGRSELAADLLGPSAAAGDGAFALVPFRAPEEGLWFDLGSPERLARAEERARATGVS